MDSISDEELFEEIKEGKNQNMESIVARYYKIIFRYIYNKINDYHMAQDLCQEVFCKIYEKRKSYSKEYLFKPWLYKIAYNSIIDYTRGKTYRNRNKVTVLDENIKEKTNVIEYKLFNNNIDDMLEGLSDAQKEVVKLRFCEQLSIEDIAIITDSNINTVKSRLYQGIKLIKSRLNKVGGGLDEAKSQ
ncbi:RNA polymerase sigma factor [Clostridium drakei]|uniref:RNA polymerase subunit sigma-24 n=1 Tax=Clostridium drakei TaxID=332101 RepID=A0A2U8DT85_9CLOT|nr:RNA polymerase sigma factor [Clostridium drakei]AWI05625.1 RNA polymerase subunit sigma-24 [Clostridium drakei]